jgi:DNA-binding response OmpR family regulator
MSVLVDLQEYRKTKSAKTIIIAEDDQLLNSLLNDFIESEFPEIAISLAYNGIEALDQLSRRIPSLMILNMMMPGLTGAEVLKRLATRRIRFPILVISGSVRSKEEVIKLSGYPEKYLSYLRKPFSLDVLAGTLRGLLGCQAVSRP